ncbi:glycine betaine ABC transporter substrate-binding protein [Streptomyces sp. NPDC086091]|uniref:glycine betaine ABC transporter substrate-binding protein n=1 Tax=Streptomyces sp. NPDC086091 TaxID=3365751 RepID=UPI003815EC22
MGTIGLPFHRAAVRRGLEAYGHPVTEVKAPHEERFRLQAAGEADVLVSAWPPSRRGDCLSAYQDRASVLAANYEPYRIWAVPPYVPAQDVVAVADLARPEVAARTTHVIDGINPGAPAASPPD